MNFYKSLFRKLAFQFNSEIIHDYSLKAIEYSSCLNLPDLIRVLFPAIDDEKLKVNIAGIDFRNPIGLAAGFDKQAVGYDFFHSVGFGSVELGTVTSKAQAGNPKPRIFRLEKDNAVINRMGFPSIGIESFLSRLNSINRIKGCPLGVNIGKAKDIPLDDAAKDYMFLAKQVANKCDYIAINVSSPNTPDLRKLQEPSRLKEIFSLVISASNGTPVFVKLAPDIETKDLNEIVSVCVDSKISALIATNTTITRPDTLISEQNLISEQGGLSGKPLFNKSVAFIKALSNISSGQIPIIGVGGIFSAGDVHQMLAAGASAVQIYTGLIYEGPFIARKICQALIKPS
jgi:dihydroorotate dehydrogenase